MKKYELTDETIEWAGRTLYRIRALKDIECHVKSGDSGGFVESENNLNHFDNCWIFCNAKVYDDAEVFGKAKIFDDAEVFGKAKIFGDAGVFGKAKIFDDAEVFGNALVFSNAIVCGDAEVFGDAEISACGRVEKTLDFIIFSNVGGESGTLTVFKNKNGGLNATRGCFEGGVDEFLKRSKNVHDEKTRLEYELLIQVAKSRILGQQIQNNQK